MSVSTSPGCSLYVIGNPVAGAVKIGISINPDRRLHQLRSGCPTLATIAAADATDLDKYVGITAEALESQCHEVLGGLSLGREWFRFDGAVVAFTDALYRVSASSLEASPGFRITEEQRVHAGDEVKSLMGIAGSPKAVGATSRRAVRPAPESTHPTPVSALGRRASLLDLAKAMPPGSAVAVPREWILDALASTAFETAPEEDVSVDLTVEQVANLFGRATSTVRGWLERGDFPGAYRRGGREWRIPKAAITAYQSEERRRAEKPSGSPVDLGAWRQYRKASA